MGLQTSAKRGILKKEWGERIDPYTVYRRPDNRTGQMVAEEAAVKAVGVMDAEGVATVRSQGTRSLNNRTSTVRPAQGKNSRAPPRSHLHEGVRSDE